MSKKYYKIVDGKKLFADQNSIIVHNGFTVLHPSEDILIDAGYQEYIEPTEPELSEEEIQRQNLLDEMNQIKEFLAAEDYKIIKCSEAFMQGKELPYDLESLITIRNNRRSRINEIEELLK